MIARGPWRLEVGTGPSGAPFARWLADRETLCGDVMRLQVDVQVDEDGRPEVHGAAYVDGEHLWSSQYDTEADARRECEVEAAQWGGVVVKWREYLDGLWCEPGEVYETWELCVRGCDWSVYPRPDASPVATGTARSRTAARAHAVMAWRRLRGVP